MMPTSSELMTPTPTQLHTLAHLWADLCAHDRAGAIPIRLDPATEGYASLTRHGSSHTLHVEPTLAELPEPAQRWLLAHQLGHHAHTPIDGHRRARLWFTRYCANTAGGLAAILALLMVLAGPHQWWHPVAVAGAAAVGLAVSAAVSRHLRDIETAANTYARHHLGVELTPDITADITPPAWPLPWLGRLLQPWATTPDPTTGHDTPQEHP